MAIIQFPGTDFHDLNLDWVLQQVKNLLTEWASTKVDWEELQANNTEFKEFMTGQWEGFRDFVLNYLHNLPLTEEVSTKIDAMVEDGTLLNLITEDEGDGSALSDVAGQWLNAHITQETGYVIDDTLTVQGAAADAKATGDAITELKGATIGEINATSIVNNPFTKANWRSGAINPTDGALSTDSTTISFNQNAYLQPAQGASRVEALTGYKFRVFAYQLDNTYVGAWNGKTFVQSWTNIVYISEFNILQYTDYKFKFVLKRDDEQSPTTDEYTNFIIKYSRFTVNGLMESMKQGNLAKETETIKGYLNSTGGIVNPVEQDNRETTTGFIAVNAEDTYTFGIYIDSSVSFWFRVAYYDADKTFISRWDDHAIYPSETWYNFTRKMISVKIPSGVSFVRISQRYGFSTLTKGVTKWDYDLSPVDIRRHWNMRTKQDYFVRTLNHRGYRRIAPENTAPAFELSADLGFYGVENDIRFTSDGVPVLLHDETINRTARNEDGTEIANQINIADITYAQALEYDFGIWMGQEYAGTRIMTFEEFVALCRKKSLYMYNEIKAGTQAQVNALIQTVKRYGMDKHCSWLSFSSTHLNWVRSYDPKARLGLIFSEFGQSNISTLTALQTDTNSVFADINADNNSTLTTALIDSLIQANIELEMYTPNFTSVINAMNPYATGFTSDWLIAGDVLYTNKNNIMVFANN